MTTQYDLQGVFQRVRDTHPLVHNITNAVTINDCANILLAAGASPIMADDPDDAPEITAICNALVINIGTLNRLSIPAMYAAASRAGELGHPIVLDPVGAGASTIRTVTAKRLLAEHPISILRGNVSEIRALAAGDTAARGVDAALADAVTPENLSATAAWARAFATSIDAVVVLSGAIDLIADATRACAVYNGHPKMSSITGTGCQLTALTGAFVAASPSTPFEAAVAATCAMGAAGQIAFARLVPGDGNSTYRNKIIDAIDHMAPDDLARLARCEPVA